jgi:V8-like Glu-specific endopeptidase
MSSRSLSRRFGLNLSYASTAPLLLAMTACGTAAESDGDRVVPDATHSTPVTCGKHPYVFRGKIYHQEEWYQFGLLNRRLDESVELRQATGLTRVDSCEDARAFVDAEHTLLESQPSLKVLPPGMPVPEAQPDADGVGKTSQAIVNGTKAYKNSVVWYNTDAGGCTGTLISPYAMITSAHCIPSASLNTDTNGDNIKDAGIASFWVNYDRDPTLTPGSACLTRAAPQSTTGLCGGNDFQAMIVHIHPGWGGGAANDIAVVMHLFTGPWRSPANGTHHYAIVNGGGLDREHNFTAWGAGGDRSDPNTLNINENGEWETGVLNSGVTRTDVDKPNVDWMGAWHFISDSKNSGGVRMCNGDSGGPAFEHTSNFFVGVWSSSDYLAEQGTLSNPAPGCTTTSKTQRWTTVSPKLWWISDTLRSYGLPGCRFTHTSGPDRFLGYSCF